MKLFNRGVARGKVALLAIGLGIATVAVAQTADPDPQTVDDGTSSTAAGLDLPSELTLFGAADPTVHKATAIVNGAIITDTDIDQRLNLVLAANGGKIEGDEKERLRLQVLRNLIDETLQVQEAKANDITITPDEIDQTYSRVSGNFKRGPKEFAGYLKQIGSSPNSLRRQIEGELAWRRLLSRRVEPFINVSDDEVKSVIARLNASKGQTEYHVGEIFLSATPATNDDVLANANRIVDQIRGGASFVAYARQFSEASTAAVGGDLGWVRAELLPDALSQVVQSLPNGAISAPIPVAGGYSIVALVDKRQVLTADPRDALLSLKQISITFAPDQTEATAAPRVQAFAAAIKQIKGCGGAADAAKTIGGEIIDNDQVKLRDLPAQLQNIIAKLNVGEATPPFGSLREGVRTLVLCGRDDPAEASGPSFDQIQSQMEEERVNRRAQRYLRDLRRDAVIEYR